MGMNNALIQVEKVDNGFIVSFEFGDDEESRIVGHDAASLQAAASVKATELVGRLFEALTPVSPTVFVHNSHPSAQSEEGARAEIKRHGNAVAAGIAERHFQTSPEVRLGLVTSLISRSSGGVYTPSIVNDAKELEKFVAGSSGDGA